MTTVNKKAFKNLIKTKVEYLEELTDLKNVENFEINNLDSVLSSLIFEYDFIDSYKELKELALEATKELKDNYKKEEIKNISKKRELGFNIERKALHILKETEDIEDVEYKINLIIKNIKSNIKAEVYYDTKINNLFTFRLNKEDVEFFIEKVEDRIRELLHSLIKINYSIAQD